MKKLWWLLLPVCCLACDGRVQMESKPTEAPKIPVVTTIENPPSPSQPSPVTSVHYDAEVAKAADEPRFRRTQPLGATLFWADFGDGTRNCFVSVDAPSHAQFTIDLVLSVCETEFAALSHVAR